MGRATSKLGRCRVTTAISRIALATLLLVGPIASAAVLIKTDGTRIEGEIVRRDEGWIVIAKDGTKIVVDPAEVKSLDVGGKPDAAATANLASLRRAIDALGDARRAVERYKDFIAKYKDTSAGTEAQLDLGMWQDRVDRGLVRVMGRWITAGEAGTLKAAATDQAKQAIEYLRQSKMQDAGDLLRDALGADPKNPTALYVRGVLSYRQDKLQDARRAFEGSLEAATNYGPTLNNIAVTCFRLNQFPLSLNYYEQALVAMPLEKGLLNNVAEALEAIPDNVKNSALYKRVKRKFDEQDGVLAQRLAQQGIFRWGATWVNQQQLDELKVAEQKNRAVLDKLAGQYQALADRLIHLDAQIAANQRDLGIMEGQTLVRDTYGRIAQLPLPPAYYTMKSQTDALAADRESTVQQQAAVRSQARAALKDTPAAKYTGIQQIFAAEAAPVPAPPANATPATKP